MLLDIAAWREPVGIVLVRGQRGMAAEEIEPGPV